MRDSDCPGSTPDPTISHRLEVKLNDLRPEDEDLLSDVIWFLRGYAQAKGLECPITEDHLVAIRRAKAVVGEYVK